MGNGKKRKARTNITFFSREFCKQRILLRNKRKRKKKINRKKLFVIFFLGLFSVFALVPIFSLKAKNTTTRKKKVYFFFQRFKKSWNVDVHGGGRWRAGLFKRRRGSIDGSPGCAGSTAAGAKRLPACMYTTTFFVFTSRRERRERDMHHDAM